MKLLTGLFEKGRLSSAEARRQAAREAELREQIAMKACAEAMGAVFREARPLPPRLLERSVELREFVGNGVLVGAPGTHLNYGGESP